MSKEPDAFDSALRTALGRLDIPVSPSQVRTLGAHFEAVVETNRVMNLTRITDPVEAAVKHYADSLALLLWTRDRSVTVRTVLDVGTGAGFPSVPLAVMQREWAVTAIDATRKKVEFLARTVASIGLTNLHIEHAHAAHWRPILRALRGSGQGSGQERPFDVVVVRALAPLGKCLELCAAFVKPGGWLVAYKTASLDRAELAGAEKLLKKTRMRIEEPFPYELQMGVQTLHRALHLFQRVR